MKSPKSPVDKQIFALAIPTFATLIAEPLFLLADSAFVGHLGRDPLAGLAAASTILQAIVGVSVFLAYGTTARVGRKVGAGKISEALRAGIDGLWLAVLLGIALAAMLILGADVAVNLLGTPQSAHDHATIYLRWSALGLPAMFVVLATTGVLRGFKDTRTPLIVSTIGAIANIGLNYLLIYPAGLGIAGSAIGTVIGQTGMGVVLAAIVITRSRSHGVSIAPSVRGLAVTSRVGAPLIVRSLAMRISIVVTTAAVASLGATELAAHQVTLTIWSTLAFALDALAIAGQAITGQALGAGRAHQARFAASRLVFWSVVSGALILLVMAPLRSYIAGVFTDSPDVIATAGLALVVVAAGQILAGYVFAWDGVLIGAGDSDYLAIASVLTTVCYVPLLGLIWYFTPGGAAGLALIWSGYAFGWMGIRAVTLWWRARSGQWAVTGNAP